MKRLVLLVILLSIYTLVCAQSVSPADILKKVEEASSNPKDQKMTMKLILIDKNNSESERSILMLQKGKDMRVGKFLSPKDQKGIGFLSLPGNVLHIYLPAYKKIKNIASHAKNGSFAGTDFTYEDMEISSFSKGYDCNISSESDSTYVLELMPRKDKETSYTKLMMTVTKDKFLTLKIDFFEKEKHTKTLERKSFEKIKEYYIAKEMTMTTLKSNHKTKMIVENAEFDTNLSDDLFTDRYLKE